MDLSCYMQTSDILIICRSSLLYVKISYYIINATLHLSCLSMYSLPHMVSSETSQIEAHIPIQQYGELGYPNTQTHIFEIVTPITICSSGSLRWRYLHHKTISIDSTYNDREIHPTEKITPKYD